MGWVYRGSLRCDAGILLDDVRQVHFYLAGSGGWRNLVYSLAGPAVVYGTADIEIDLLDSTGEPAKVALIQMPNGSGKTDTLELINTPLSYEGASWTARPGSPPSASARPSDDPRASSSLKFLVNGWPLTLRANAWILRKWGSGAIWLTTNVGYGGIVTGWAPSRRSASQFSLRQNFLRLFIFDGEFADVVCSIPKKVSGQTVAHRMHFAHYTGIRVCYIGWLCVTPAKYRSSLRRGLGWDKALGSLAGLQDFASGLATAILNGADVWGVLRLRLGASCGLALRKICTLMPRGEIGIPSSPRSIAGTLVSGQSISASPA